MLQLPLNHRSELLAAISCILGKGYSYFKIMPALLFPGAQFEGD